MKRALAMLLAAGAAAGCADAGEDAKTGAAEPLLVHGAQFVPGALPSDTGGPRVLTVESQNNALVAGQAGKKLAGNVAGGAMALALRFEDLGTGYWTLPVGVPDPATPGALTWEAVCDFARDLPVGKHELRFAASDRDGAWGPSSDLGLTVRSLVPDGRVVISLTWDSPADLDLHVWAPNGKEITSKTPSSALVTDAGASPGAGDGKLDRDSNASCIDGPRTEDVVFSGGPMPGVWSIYVDEFDACGAPGTTFQVVVYVEGEERLRQGGRLIDLDASGGVRADGRPGPLGAYVTQLLF